MTSVKTENALTDKIGMWVFLATEICFFATLFLSFIIYRHESHEAFHIGSQHMNILAGTLNTGILLTSSLCVAMADLFFRKNNYQLSVYLLIITFLLGFCFLGIKGYEYIEHIHSHLLPGFDFHYAGKEERGVKMFFVLYLIMTALHAVHLLVGLIVLLFLIMRMHFLGQQKDYSRGVELSALYWHFVDLIWVFLFPLLYLVDRA